MVIIDFIDFPNFSINFVFQVAVKRQFNSCCLFVVRYYLVSGVVSFQSSESALKFISGILYFVFPLAIFIFPHFLYHICVVFVLLYKYLVVTFLASFEVVVQAQT